MKALSFFAAFYFLIYVSVATAAIPQHIQSGLDVLVAEKFAPVANKRVGVVCNHTARNKQGEHLVDLLQRSGVCQITAIFGPEHGFRGTYADGCTITDTIDAVSGAHIYSLYGTVTRPTPAMLQNVDLLIYDIQDVGVRFYTYITTLTNVMESAAEMGIPIIVLDRPNPIRGDRVEGPLLDLRFRSFVGPHPLPTRYGLTIGELAQLINNEGWLRDSLRANLTIIKMRGWRRSFWYDETDLPWVPPSPNMKTIETAIVYPGFCLLEASNISEGRGTESPFLQFGAPWIDGQAYAAALNKLALPGVQFIPTKFAPREIPGVAHKPKYEGEVCQGVQIKIINRDRFQPIQAAIEVLLTTQKLYPDKLQWRSAGLDRLYGSDELRNFLNNGGEVREFFQRWEAPLVAFTKIAQRYYLYE